LQGPTLTGRPAARHENIVDLNGIDTDPASSYISERTPNAPPEQGTRFRRNGFVSGSRGMLSLRRWHIDLSSWESDALLRNVQASPGFPSYWATTRFSKWTPQKRDEQAAITSLIMSRDTRRGVTCQSIPGLAKAGRPGVTDLRTFRRSRQQDSHHLAARLRLPR